MKTKSTILALLGAIAMASTANASIILGWHDFGTAQPGSSLPRTANLNNLPFSMPAPQFIQNGGGNSSGGSDTETWGSSMVYIGPNTENTGYATIPGPAIQVASTYIDIPGSAAYAGLPIITTLYFDAVVVGATEAVLRVTWGYLTDSLGFVPAASDTVNVTTVGTPTSGQTETYQEFAISLSQPVALPTGADNQRLQFYFDTITGGDGRIRLDNVALSVIPEPTNVMALALLLTSGVMFRNRRRKA